MKPYKPFYVENYKVSDRFYEKNKSNDKYSHEDIRNFTEAVIRVEPYVALLNDKIDNFYRKYKNVSLQPNIVANMLSQWFYTYNINFYENDVEAHLDKEETGINKAGTRTLRDGFIEIRFYYNLSLPYILIDNEIFKKFKKNFLLLCSHELTHRGRLLNIKDKELRYSISNDAVPSSDK